MSDDVINVNHNSETFKLEIGKYICSYCNGEIEKGDTICKHCGVDYEREREGQMFKVEFEDNDIRLKYDYRTCEIVLNKFEEDVIKKYLGFDDDKQFNDEMVEHFITKAIHEIINRRESE